MSEFQKAYTGNIPPFQTEMASLREIKEKLDLLLAIKDDVVTYRLEGV